MKKRGLALLLALLMLGCSVRQTVETTVVSESPTVPPATQAPAQVVEFSAPAPTSEPVTLTPMPTPTDTPVPTPEPTPTPIPTPTPLPTPFTIAWLSDTQGYAFRPEEGLVSAVNYILAQKENLNFVAVVQTGDIVEKHEQEKQWEKMEGLFAPFRGKIPFYCVAGNHDVGQYGMMHKTYQYYLAHQLCDVQSEEQTFEGGKCWYELREDLGLLLIGIGWMFDGDGERFAQWAGEVLDRYSEYPAILLTHSFIYTNGKLDTDGVFLERELIAKHSNVRLLLCGHHDGTRRWSKTYENGRTFTAMMLNFQDDFAKSRGYFTLLTFDPLFHTVSVTTYSPFFDDYNYYSNTSKETFVLENAF